MDMPFGRNNRRLEYPQSNQRKHKSSKMTAKANMDTIMAVVRPESLRCLHTENGPWSKCKGEQLQKSLDLLNQHVDDIIRMNYNYDEYLKPHIPPIPCHFFVGMYRARPRQGEINVTRITPEIFGSIDNMLNFQAQTYVEAVDFQRTLVDDAGNETTVDRRSPHWITHPSLKEILNFSRCNALSLFGFFGPIIRAETTAMFAVRMRLSQHALLASGAGAGGANADAGVDALSLAGVRDLGKQLSSFFIGGDTRREMTLSLGRAVTASSNLAVHDEAIAILQASLPMWNISNKSKDAIVYALLLIFRSRHFLRADIRGNPEAVVALETDLSRDLTALLTLHAPSSLRFI